jgi:hypothetical protein
MEFLETTKHLKPDSGRWATAQPVNGGLTEGIIYRDSQREPHEYQSAADSPATIY